MNQAPASSPPHPAQNPPRKKKTGCLIASFGCAFLFVGTIVLFMLLGIFAGRDVDKMAAAADPFFQSIKGGHIAAAYDLTAKSYRDTHSLEEFTKFVDESGLADYASGEWNYAISGDGEDEAIEGHFLTSKGEKIPLYLAFVSEGDRARIAAIRKPAAAAAPASSGGNPAPPAPAASGGDSGGEKKLFGFSFSTAKIKNLSLTMNPEGGTGIVEEFPDNTKGIYFKGDLVSAMDGTEITSNWYNLDMDPSQPMISKTLQAGSPAKAKFSLVRSADMLPSGQYRLDIAIAGKVKNSLNFRIREATHEELKASADAGDITDAYRIFLLHLGNEQSGVPVDEAVRYLSLAAEGGHARAQFNLAVLYDQGNFLPEDPAAATKWYRKAAAQGDSSAQLNLAQKYRESGGSGIEVGEAIDWTKKSAESGDPRAMYALGIYVLTGTGTEKNPALAVELFEKGAALDPVIAVFLGDAFENGKDLPKDLAKAKQWYQSAAERGEPNAAAALQRLNAGGQ